MFGKIILKIILSFYKTKYLFGWVMPTSGEDQLTSLPLLQLHRYFLPLHPSLPLFLNNNLWTYLCVVHISGHGYKTGPCASLKRTIKFRSLSVLEFDSWFHQAEHRENKLEVSWTRILRRNLQYILKLLFHVLCHQWGW